MKLSIITINYNNAEGLRKTLTSVASQTYAEIEHIIIDGGSTDNSVEVIREYADNQAKGERLEAEGSENSKTEIPASTPYTLHHTPPTHIVRWISEPDKGIYNAMNKGIEIALGRRIVNDDYTSSPLASNLSPLASNHYIQILNSGDILAAPDITERMMAALLEDKGYRLEVKGNEEAKGERLKAKGLENGEADTPASHLSPLASRLENCPAIFYGNMTKVNAAGQIVGKSGYTEYSLRQFSMARLLSDTDSTSTMLALRPTLTSTSPARQTS